MEQDKILIVPISILDMNADNFFGPVILYGLEMKSVMCFHRLIAEIPEILVGNKKNLTGSM